MGWDAERFGALPEDGGLRDQLVGDTRRMRAALNVYNSVLTWDKSDGKKLNEIAHRYIVLDFERSNNANL